MGTIENATNAVHCSIAPFIPAWENTAFAEHWRMRTKRSTILPVASICALDQRGQHLRQNL
jgi:hypothetical protein